MSPLEAAEKELGRVVFPLQSDRESSDPLDHHTSSLQPVGGD